MRFIDTNILIYSVGMHPEEASKSRIARKLLYAPDLALSVQVLQEFYTSVTRVNRRGRFEHEEAVVAIRALKRYPVQPMTLPILDAALETNERFQISYWDAAIIEAARALGCEVVLSEDLQYGQDFNGVRVVDPFREK